MSRFFVALISIFIATASVAVEPALKVAHAWARATAPGAPNGGVFMRIDNAGSADDRLLSAASDRARAVELHTHRMEGGVARMVAQPTIALPAGKATEFAPGGLHVMLIGLVRPLQEGERFPLTLRFEKAGTQQVEVMVRSIGAGAPQTGMHH